MINLNGILCENNLTKDDLIKRIIVEKTTNKDIIKITEILTKGFDLSSQREAIHQLAESDVDLENSVKLIDKTNGDIYGLLIFSNFPLHLGSPLMMFDNELGKFLSNLKQINGHSFIIDERLRGCGFDKKMLYHNMDFIKQHDMIWCAVEKDLKSHNYWKKIGFHELFKVDEASFYIKILNLDIITTIYNSITNYSKHENNN